MITEEKNKKCIEQYIEQYEKEWSFADNLIYKGCLEALKRIDLSKIEEKDVKGPIRTFLINWGMMGRVVGRLKKGWEKELATKIKINSKKLNNFRYKELSLINFDLNQMKADIIDCYKSLRIIVGPTSASKILHLICPNFFPMWDCNIRKRVSDIYKSRKNSHKGIGESPEGYFKFIQEIQVLLKKYDEVLLDLSKQYDKGKLKLIDEFLWEIAH